MATQADRAVELKTPLGDDILVVRQMTGSEELGRLFEYELTLGSDDFAIKADDILGQKVTVRLDLDDETKRYFNGVVSRFAQSGRSQVQATYQMTVRPWLWFLTRRADCRIFQEMTVPEIIKKVFQDDGFSDFEEAFHGSYTPWTYCVQYRETDFNFVSRLMEQEGIYYYFKHEENKHTLMLCDAPNAHSPLAGNKDVVYNASPDKAHDQCIYDWAVTREVVPGAYALQDFDFERPSVDLTAQSKQDRNYKNAKFEVYDYPGEYIQDSDGKGYAKARIEELQWQFQQCTGAGTVRGFHPGGLFNLTEHPRDAENAEYLVVATNHDLQSAGFESGGGGGGGTACMCGFTAITSDTPFRTARLTPKPVIQGPQTAIVVGPAGDEIYTDKYGRVKVQFHWDRIGKKDENSSCWIRVAQVWAGNTWGAIQIPRIGQEVMVEFLEGDPDQPIITGRVYNAEQMPPYPLPDNATQSGIKSRSSKGGADANFNEIRMEDKKGSEELYIHAEKNHTNITENDRSEDVGHDRALHVGHDKSELIDNNKTITVGASHSESIGGAKTLTVSGSHTESVGTNMLITIGATLTEAVAINYSETVGAAMELTVGGAYAETVGLAKAETIGLKRTVTVGADQSVDVNGDETVNIGKKKTDTIGDVYQVTVAKDYTLKCKQLSIEAEDEITIKTGSAMISMKKNGDIAIEGNNLTIKGDGNVTIKGSKIAQN